MNQLKKLTTKETAEMNSLRWWHQIPIGVDANGVTIYTPGEVSHGVNGEDYFSQRFGMPQDLANKRVLDIGAWDGLFSFEAESRGASYVLATDVENVKDSTNSSWLSEKQDCFTTFEFAKRILGSKVEHQVADIQSPKCNNEIPYNFDVVMCYGILYHLKNPFFAFENLSLLTASGGMCLIETAGIPISQRKEGKYPYWELRAGYDNDVMNFYYPTPDAVIQGCKLAGFTSAVMHSEEEGGTRFVIKAIK